MPTQQCLGADGAPSSSLGGQSGHPSLLDGWHGANSGAVSGSPKVLETEELCLESELQLHSLPVPFKSIFLYTVFIILHFDTLIPLQFCGSGILLNYCWSIPFLKVFFFSTHFHIISYVAFIVKQICGLKKEIVKKMI